MLTNYVNGYQHVGIPTDNINNTTAFYLNLGFKLKWETFYEGSKVRFLEWGNILIETYEKKEKVSNAIGAIDHIALACTDIVSCVREAKKLNYEFYEGPSFLPYWEYGVAYFTLLGPNSEIVEFIQKFNSNEEKEKAVKEIG